MEAVIQESDLDTLANKINKAHTAAITSARTAIEEARKAGDLLLEAKKLCPHGEWQSWLKANVEFSGRTARKYMQLSSKWQAIESKRPPGAILGINETLELVSKRRPPDPHRQRLTKLLRSQATNEIMPVKLPGPIDGSDEDAGTGGDVNLDHHANGNNVDLSDGDDGQDGDPVRCPNHADGVSDEDDPENFDWFDEVGNAVPDHLISVFDIGEQFKEIDKALLHLRIKARDLSRSRAGFYLDENESNKAFRQLRQLLKAASPYRACPNCVAPSDRCDGCHGIGFFTKDRAESSGLVQVDGKAVRA